MHPDPDYDSSAQAVLSAKWPLYLLKRTNATFFAAFVGSIAE
jgi:hypothetical protein